MNEEQEGIEIDSEVEGGIVLSDVDEEELEETENAGEDALENTEHQGETEEQEEVQEESKEDKLSSMQKALNAERKKSKELRKQLKALEANKTTKSTYDTLIEQGVDKELAKTLTEAMNKPNAKVADLKFETDLLRVSKKPEFADIEDYSDEVRDFVDKGLTIEQAYYAATGGKSKVTNTKSEIKRELEAKMKNQKQRAEILDIDTNSSVTNNNQNKLKYSSIELAIAKKAGMTIEEYKAMQKMSTINEYDKHIKGQVKR